MESNFRRGNPNANDRRMALDFCAVRDIVSVRGTPSRGEKA